MGICVSDVAEQAGEINTAIKAPKVLMVGPGRNVKGGISTVVNSYYEVGLDKRVSLKYIASMEDGTYIKKIWVALKAYFQFFFCIKNYDIVHIHMAAHASYTRKSFFVKRAHQKKKKIIIHVHAGNFDNYFLNQLNSKKREGIRYIFSLADKVITLSEKWAEFFSKYICDPEKVVILHNAVVPPYYVKADYNDHNILFLGKLCQQKGIYDLLKVIPDIVKSVPDIMFFLGGDGDMEECKRIVKNEGISDHIKFTGWVAGSDKEMYLKKSSVFVLPSYFEGMPISVLEAMSYGLATIATNVGGVPQIIDNWKDGVIVKTGDTEGLRESILKLLLDVKSKEIIGRAANQKILKNFNMQKSSKNLLILYFSLENQT
jgi:glycosyltransferase involved in cell wall biosynthesis